MFFAAHKKQPIHSIWLVSNALGAMLMPWEILYKCFFLDDFCPLVRIENKKETLWSLKDSFLDGPEAVP